MVRLIFMLFVGISVVCGGVDAARPRSTRDQGNEDVAVRSAVRRSGSIKKSDSATSGRRGRVQGARSAFVGSAVVGNETAADATKKDDYAKVDDDALNQKIKTLKNEVNAVEQCVMTLCDAGTDSDETTMALCSNDYKKKKLADREESLRENEDAVRRTLSAIPRQKLTSAEKDLYDSINVPEKQETEDDSLDFDSLMGQIEDMSDSLDTAGGQRRVTGDVLLEKAVEICANKFPEVVLNKDDFIALMTVRADNSASALSEYYDKKAYKLEVALDQAKNKLQMAAVNAHRDLEDTDTCVQSIITKAQSLYGANFAELARCDDLTDSCAAKNFAQFEDSKSAFATTLDGCKDGDSAWELALMQVQRTLAQSAKSEIFESKSESVEALAEVQEMCLSEMSSCIENICGGAESGNIFCYSGNDPFRGKGGGLNLYKESDVNKVTSIFQKMNKKYNIELKQVTLQDAKQACAHRFEKCDNRLALLAENPDLSKQMLDTNLDANRLFKQSFANIQIKADRDFTKHEGNILETQLAAIKTRLATRVELAQAELTEEKAEMTAKTDLEKAKMLSETDLEKAKVQDLKQRNQLEVSAKTSELAKERDIEKAALEDEAVRSENEKEMAVRKMTAETEKMKSETKAVRDKIQNKAKLARVKQEGRIDAERAEKDPFYKMFCDEYGGEFDQEKRTCTFGVHATRNNRNSWDFTVSVSPTQGTSLVCKKGNHGISKKPKGCTFKNGKGLKGNKGMFSTGKSCSLPSLDKIFQVAKAGKDIGGTCFGTLDLGDALQKIIGNTTGDDK
ncbi:MAG: hypothetical protein JW812_03270 [Alphaproteobacteria bacterium]|nr:hypothetical protein [Alphaproteobacteria bacterium]MBN2779829.1 hypothetical protein [Alphaproteobacteria bacterium]